MSLQLPEALSQKAARLAEKNGYASATDYLQDLLESEEPETSPFAGREAEIGALLLKTLEKGAAAPMTREDWAEIRRRVLASTPSDAPGS
ncbi:MAG: hypothetical protein ACRC8S_12860 [Fimbriiglobus sp.]